MPAWAVWASCWEVTPDTPIDPMILPSWTIGMPPSRTLKPVDRKRRFTPPLGDAVLQNLGRPTQRDRRAGLLLGDVDAAPRVVVEPLNHPILPTGMEHP